VEFLMRPSRLRTKKPRPTLARGTGRYTDLFFPTTVQRREGRWCSTESNGVFGRRGILKQCTHLG